MRRLLIVSDIHGALGKARQLRDVKRDVTIVAGDVARCNSVEEAVSILEELAGHGAELVWVPGNCDSPRLLEAKAPGHLVHGAAAEVEGLWFVGAGGSTYTPFSTPFEYSDDELGEILSKALETVPPEAPTVFVVHTPPYRSGLDRVSGGEYVGSRRLRDLLRQRRPLLLATGHIHEAWGVAAVDGVTTVNPGPLESGRYALVDIDAEAGAVRARTLKLRQG